MEQLAKKAAEIALRLAALAPGGTPDAQTLDALEQLATQILKDVSTARLGKPAYAVGETRGVWRIVPRQ